MESSNVYFLVLVSFLAISIIVVAMLPVDACRPDPPRGGIDLSSEGRPMDPTSPTYRLGLASLYLQDLQARNWEKPSICLAAPTFPAQLASATVEDPGACTRQSVWDNRPEHLEFAR